MSEFEINFQDEVDRKAFAALEQLADGVESGLVTPENGRYMLSILQTGFSGLVENDKEFFGMLNDFDSLLSDYPKATNARRTCYYETEDSSAQPAVVVIVAGCKLKVCPKGQPNKEKTFELPQEAFEAAMTLHNKLISKGLHNL